MKTRAAILSRPGAPLSVVDDLELPPPERGQVLVRVAFAGVCHSQLAEVRGWRGEDRYLPHLLGHEATGTVVAVGPGVTKVSPGQRVVLGWLRGEGLDAPGPRCRRGAESVNAGGVTTFSDHTVVAENRCVPLPDGVPMDVGVLFGCAILTGAGIVLNQLRPPAGSTLAVFGLGGVGLSALLAAGSCGCRTVVAVDVEPAKLDLARELGATHALNAATADPVAGIRALTGGAGADFAVEATGQAASIESAFAAVRRGGGLCVFASHPPAGSRISLDPFDLICGKRIEGSWGGACRPDVDVPRIAELYLRQGLPFGRLLSRRYPLAAINQALDDLEARRVVRPLIELNP